MTVTGTFQAASPGQNHLLPFCQPGLTWVRRGVYTAYRIDKHQYKREVIPTIKRLELITVATFEMTKESEKEMRVLDD